MSKKLFKTIPLIIIFLSALFFMFYGERSAYLSSILLLCCGFLALAFYYEKSRQSAAELVLTALFCALAVAGRAVLFYIPSVKAMTAIIILAGIFMGAKNGFTVGVCSAFVSNFLFGQGPWTPWQMLSWGIIGLLAGIIFYNKKANTFTVCLYGALSVFLIFAPIMNPASLFLVQADSDFAAIIAAMIAGFPFDLIHSLSTCAFLFLLYKPMRQKIFRMQVKYGLFCKS